MFERPHHRYIAQLLGTLDSQLLRECECGFAGGTAIAMLLDEFRRSDDIDLLCASTDGYRRLRETVFDKGLAGLARDKLPVVRQPRADQYGIRAVIGTSDKPVKFEIVREARIQLSLGSESIAGVTLLSRDDLYAEKLLANADRGLDASTLHRDIIDLCMMVHMWGPIPEFALDKARSAYGSSICRSLAKVARQLQKSSTLRTCLQELDADPERVDVLGPIINELATCGHSSLR